MLEVKNLTYSFSKKEEPVLKDISFSLEEGKVGLLLGLNGAGKTTLMKALVGLLKCPKDTIFVQGKDYTLLERKEKAKLISYVPQSFSFQSMSVFDAVLVGRLPYTSFYPSQADLEKVSQLIEELGLSNLSAKSLSEISLGERQRVEIARALAQEPKILFMDEPSSSLDIPSRLALYDLIKKLAHERKVSVLLSMHSLEDAFRLGDTFYLLKDGVLLAQGDESILNEKNLNKTYNMTCQIYTINNQKIISYQNGEFTK